MYLAEKLLMNTGRILFDMQTVYETKIADFMTINRTSIELCFHGISL